MNTLLAKWSVCFTFLSVALFASPSRSQEQQADAEIVWQLNEATGLTNHFRARMGEDVPFPKRWIQFTSLEFNRLLFLDSDGGIEDMVELVPEEEVLASEDASSYLVWRVDPNQATLSHLRYYRRGEFAADWHASVLGAPKLIASDGSFFVVASDPGDRDLFSLQTSRAELQVVGAGGEIRGELPIVPIFSSLTHDERKVAFLHDDELMVLRNDGRIAWRTSAPFDNLTTQVGLERLVAGIGTLAVGGTGKFREASDGISLHPKRRGVLRMYTDEGKLLWEERQREDEDLWFNMSLCLSPNGTRLTTCHSTTTDVVLRQLDAENGELLWDQKLRRTSGFRSISSTNDLTVVAYGDTQTSALAWDAEGNLVWKGSILLTSRLPRIREGNLLETERWIAALTLADDS